MLSFSEENHLKSIFHLSTDIESEVSTNSIADNLNTKASSVTEMLKKLGEKNLIVYKKYHGAQLTEMGRKTALNIIRKHRLWEVFLTDKLNFGWEEVHEIAEQLEHIKSEELTIRLEEFLDHPKFDPLNGYWRGPNWLDQAYFGVKGLRNYGFNAEADKATVQLLKGAEGVLGKGKSIRENYHPISGEGREAQNFSWSAAHIIMLLTD